MGKVLSKKATSENFINPPVQETVQENSKAEIDKAVNDSMNVIANEIKKKGKQGKPKADKPKADKPKTKDNKALVSPVVTDIAVDENMTIIENALISIDEHTKKMESDFIAIGSSLAWFRDTNAFLTLNDRDGQPYKTIEDFAFKCFNIKRSTCFSYIKVAETFGLKSDSGEINLLQDKYKDYSYTQLQAMVYGDADKLDLCKPDMTVKQIKEIVKKDRSKKQKQETNKSEPVTSSNVDDTAENIPTIDAVNLYHIVSLEQWEQDKQEIIKGIEKSLKGGGVINIDYTMSTPVD